MTLLHQLVESAKQLQGSFLLAKEANREDVASLIRLTMLRLNEAIHCAMQEVRDEEAA